MEMDGGTIAVLVITLTFFALPFVLDYRRRARNGARLLTEAILAVALQTRPPSRFTEATLLSAMEGAGKLVEDEELREAAARQNCTLDEYDTHGDMAIGMDADRKTVFFLGKRGDADTLQHVHLAKVRACHIVKAQRGAKGAQADRPIDRVELNFLPKDNSNGEVRFVLYREMAGSSLNGEAQLAEKWEDLVQRQLEE